MLESLLHCNKKLQIIALNFMCKTSQLTVMHCCSHHLNFLSAKLARTPLTKNILEQHKNIQIFFNSLFKDEKLLLITISKSCNDFTGQRYFQVYVQLDGPSTIFCLGISIQQSLIWLKNYKSLTESILILRSLIKFIPMNGIVVSKESSSLIKSVDNFEFLFGTVFLH